MADKAKTVIVTGASQGIGAGIVTAFLERGYRVVATSRSVTRSEALPVSDNLARVDGNIGEPATAEAVTRTAIDRFGSIDALVNNAGIFFTKPFTDYTPEDFRSLVATNLEGFLYVTQLAIKRMLSRKTGGSVVNITASLADNPIAGVPASVPMITKGGLNAVTLHLAMEYARDGIRVNAVAPGVVATPLHKNTQEEFLKKLSPMGRLSTMQEIAAAVLYLTEAPTVTGEVLHVDGGAHRGKW
jgi:NAD(P)-dependent dehydrogenase (short-subunit alcohol dehydrogenase family)